MQLIYCNKRKNASRMGLVRSRSGGLAHLRVAYVLPFQVCRQFNVLVRVVSSLPPSPPITDRVHFWRKKFFFCLGGRESRKTFETVSEKVVPSDGQNQAKSLKKRATSNCQIVLLEFRIERRTCVLELSGQTIYLPGKSGKQQDAVLMLSCGYLIFAQRGRCINKEALVNLMGPQDSLQKNT